ncbi:hypothetical protein ACOME3_008285 [Neoechinorhynchus agilis]
MATHIAYSIVQGMVNEMEKDICAAIGNSECCHLTAVRYRVLVFSGDIYVRIRIKYNGCIYYDIEGLFSIDAPNGAVMTFLEIIRSNVDPTSSL